MNEENAPEQRKLALARLLETEPDLSQAEMAERLGVTTRTIKRDLASLRARQELLPARPTRLSDPERRAAMAQDGTIDTYAAARRNLRETERALHVLEAEMGFEQAECPCCGRARLATEQELPDDSNGLDRKKKRGNDALSWQSLFKGREALAKTIELLARLLGQLENVQVIIRDADIGYMSIIHAVTNITELEMEVDEQGQPYFLKPNGAIDVTRVTRALGTRIFTELWGKNESRKRRTPGFQGIIDGQFEDY